jgi:predicted TIM-barrel fold metal-dependent hydrolase
VGILKRSQVALVIHPGHSTSGFTESDELDPIEEVATRFPGAVIIIAHCGHRATAKALDIIERNTNVYADLTPVVFEPVALPPGRA